MLDLTAFAALIKRKRGEKRMTQATLALDVFGDSTRKGDISRIENAKVQPQEATIQKLCAALDISNAELDPIRTARASARQLNDIPTLSRDELELLAGRFDAQGAHSQTDADLRSFLTLKAEEYRLYRAQIEGIDERNAGLGNLKAAARDAAERLDFAEVETLLSRVHEVEVEIAAETAELRAQNALLRGRVEQAFTLLSAAADSFAVIDPIEPARRRLHAYVKILVAHAESYGGDSLRHAKVMTIAAIESFGKETAPGLWADGKTWLGSILQTKGVHTQGDAGDVLLSRAVAAFREALTVYTLEDHRTGWAMVQHNLANTLYYKARSAARTDAPGLLEEAVTAFQSVLMVHSPTFGPFQWASAKNSLGVAMIEQSVHADRSDALLLCDAAITAFSDALTVRTKDQYPVYWAATVNNLATAHREKGARTKGREGLELLERSLADCHTALSVRKFDQAPLPWADTMQGLAKTEICIARHEATENPRPHLLAAIAHLERAMTVFDASDMQQVLGNAAQLRDELKAQLDAP